MTQEKFQKAKMTKQRILEVALGQFLEQGYEKTTMRGIAQIAGLAPGAIYYHFKSKEHIIFYYYEKSQHDQIANVNIVLAEKQTFKERVAGAIQAHLEVARPYHQISKVLFKVAADPGHALSPFGDESRETRNKDIALLREVVSGSSDRIPRNIQDKLPELLWLLKMVIILFWIYDKSPEQVNTFRLIERSAGLLAKLVQMSNLPVAKGLLNQVVDMVYEFKPFQ